MNRGKIVNLGKLIVENDMMKVRINNINESLEEIADHVGAFVQGDSIRVPSQIGDGYYKQYLFAIPLKMIVVNCSFKEEFHLIRSPLPQEKHTLVLRFHNIFSSDDSKKKSKHRLPPYVYITTGDMASEVTFSAGEKIQNIIISIEADYLFELLGSGKDIENPVLKELLSNRKPFLFEELMTPKIHTIVNEIENSELYDQSLSAFYHQLKAMELIYLFLDEFLKRESVTYNSINKRDVEIIYAIREGILKDLSIVPVLPLLAQKHGISESKMKKLFNQVFGQSIYQYFQQFRIQKAAQLIRDQRCSVSEAGFQIGFTNLSHFTRLFERFMGEKPKRYSKMFQNHDRI